MINSVRAMMGGAAIAIALMAFASTAFAQGGVTSTLSGTVLDSSGAVIPGAGVIVKRAETGVTTEAVTNADGQFTIPQLAAGKYTVTVSLSGFKTATVNDVELNAGVPAGVKVKLEVGGVEEQVVVQAGSEVVKTQASTVSTTLSSKQIQSLPLTSRSGLDFVANLPGVNTPGNVRDSTVNGLPQGAINITLDGMSIQDNYLKTTDGFFARVSPRLDAIDEVTVTSAANGADSGGQGAINIRFVTKSGTNVFKGSTFFTLRHDALNANTFFNNRNLPPDPATGKAPKAELRQYQPGFNAGGPIVIPGLYDGHDKGFFFFAYEDTRSPSFITRQRVILTEAAANGAYTYGNTTVNLLQLAAANGQTSTLDPLIAKLFADMRKASASGSIVNLSDPILQQATFQVDSNGFTPYPTGRVDYNLTKNHRLSGSFSYNHINSTPDTTNNREPFFPGFPNTGSQQSTRYLVSVYYRSTFGGNVVNTFHGGGSGGATYFSPELAPSLFGGNSIGDQAGYYLNIGNGCCATALANAGGSGAFQAREASTRVFEDDLNWIRGKHSLSFGASMTKGILWLQNQTMVPEIRFGIVTGDPAAGMFTSSGPGANFPGASTTQLNNARAMYGLLTGRVSQILGNARLDEDTNQYTYLGNGFQRGYMRQWGFYGQDNWRVRNDLTINAGLRYELQQPFLSTNNSYSTAAFADVCGISGVGQDGQCNLFKPGTLTGKAPQYVNYAQGTPAFKTDRNNFAPSLGMTWRPSAGKGLLGKIVGQDGDTVLFGSYALAYERAGMADFSDVFGDNPGVSIAVNRNATLGNLNNDGKGFPVLFRDPSRLGAPPFSASQQYPLAATLSDTVHIFNPDLQVPYAQTWAGGIRRKLTRDIGLEVRYVGTRHLQGWGTFDLNEADITSNGFINEFRKAQANLQANLAAGRGATFAYTGVPGTSPLPIYLAYLTGTPASQSGDTSKYTGSLWSDTNFTNPLAIYNPNPFTPAGTNANTGLDGDAGRRANAAAAGLPVNLFRLSPDVASASIEGNTGYTRYDSLQMELTKRLSHGLLLQGSYVFGNAYTSSRYSLKAPRLNTLQTGTEAGVTHALKANWVYELPFGNSRRWLSSSNGWVDRLAGGWEIDGVVRIQSGRLLDFGNVRLVGMSEKELREAIKIREFATTGISATAPVNIYMMPQDIIENTIRAFSVSATSATGYSSLGAPTGRYLAPANGPDCIETIANAYGDCGTRTLVVTGPAYHRWDISAAKRTRLVGRTTFEFRADLLNAFNHANFTPVISTSTNADNYRITGVQENSSRVIQLVARVSW